MSHSRLLILVLILLPQSLILAQSNEFNSGKTFGYEVEFTEPPHFRLTSDEEVNGKPLFDYFILVKAKLNGYYDFGQLPDNETFNVGKIDVWGNDAPHQFGLDMHQSQIRFRGERQTNNGTVVGYFEFDAWGGNNHLRLRHMWVQYRFIQFGQDWSMFGDKEIWPNVFDWDGPPSGIWRREPELRLYKENDNGMRVELGAAKPLAQITFSTDFDTTVTNSNQNIPDIIGALNRKTSWGHFRFTAIYRNLQYTAKETVQHTHGYGATFSTYIKTNKIYSNPIQLQLVAGTGIASYVVSFEGLNYDAAPDGDGNIRTIPTIGGWISYEHWLNNKWHANGVFGYSWFKTHSINEYNIPGPGYHAEDSRIRLDHLYVLTNLMFDPTDNLTFGVEYNYGVKQTAHSGHLTDESTTEEKDAIDKSRSASRISFGVFFNF